MFVTHEQKRVLKETFGPVLEKSMFRQSLKVVSTFAAGIIGLSLIIGLIFGHPFLYSIIGFFLVAFGLIMIGPTIDAAIAYQVSRALTAVTESFKSIPQDQRQFALDHLKSNPHAEKQLVVDPFGHLTVIFKVS